MASPGLSRAVIRDRSAVCSADLPHLKLFRQTALLLPCLLRDIIKVRQVILTEINSRSSNVGL